MMLRKLVSVFILAFILNWIWEFFHSRLYLHYQNGPITSFILFRAALVDALIILILVVVAQKFKINKSLFVVLAGLVVAIVVEIWALKTGRWAYNSLMPIIPIIKIGLSPTLQLAMTAFIAQQVVYAIIDRDQQS